ncbi:hypothetical protein KGF56_003215 [Candida oxycetoniae]|uniref:DUF895 domain membrane protein n=1 Tax=Candida oxycetoniae TaxID=497107 RepID=A0AAI9SVP0_9ASCO|nr:uncharacterized protein KGF56_003215 [Candida oxycetoniae]KAI3403948.2 hypothetical protein KGF56_003215 [Candida oxycetoniae]
MADEEKITQPAAGDVSSTSSGSKDLEATAAQNNDENEILVLKHHTSAEIESSGNWYDKSVSIFGHKVRYSNAMTQIIMVAFVIFMTPGMFNALSGIGASISDKSTSDNAAVALYSTFATIGFFGGTICNTIGVRSSLIFGGTGYALYAGSLLCFNHTENKGFVIFSGAILGVCAAVLWSAQGLVVLSYATEENKGKAIMVFWVIFNLGAVIGSIIPLADNMENQTSSANDGTFIAFIILMCCGSAIAFFMLPTSKVWKSDGSKVISQKHPNWKTELIDLFRLLIKEPKILFMFPMFFASNWFYTYQFNNVNHGMFNLRTRSLNSLLYWFAQMIGAIVLGLILDFKRFKRSTRAKIGWSILFLTGLAIWGGGLKFQLQFTREETESEPPLIEPMDFKDGKYIGPMFLYIFYGVYDAIFQTFVLWTLGALSNNPKKVALYAGFYKGIQSAGAAIAWRLDAIKVPYMDLFASSWGLVQGSLLIGLPLIWFKIKDHTDALKDGMDDVVGLEEIEVVKSNVEHKE